MREIRGPGESGGGWLANVEATPYNLLRCPMRGPQVARESGTAGKPPRTLAAYRDLLGLVLSHANSLMSIDPHLEPSSPKYAAFLSLVEGTGRQSLAPRIEVHRVRYKSLGPSRDFRPVEEWEDVFRRNLGPRLSAAGLSVEVFIWNDFHDRYLISNLAGLSLPSGFDTTSAKDKTTWSRLGRSDRDDIQREFDPASNRHGLKHRFTIP